MSSLLQSAFDPTSFRDWGHELIDVLADHLEKVQSHQITRVIPWQDPEAALTYWREHMEGKDQSPIDILRDILHHSTQLQHPRYMGHQVSAPAPLAALTGLVSDLLNNGMAVYEMGMVSNPLEKIVLEYVAAKIGFNSSMSSGVITSGGTLATLTALLTARSLKATDEVWSTGNVKQYAVLVSEEAHYCVERAVKIMGWGDKGLIKVPVNEQFQMRTELLETYFEDAIKNNIEIIAVIGSACSTATGSYDDLEAIGLFCASHHLWFHVDGAHGGAVVFSAQYRHLVRGIHEADSVVIDFHKMMLVPSLSTALIFKNGNDAYHCFHQKAHYLFHQGTEWYNSGKRTFECTKSMIVIKFYLLYKTYGPSLFEDFINKTYDLAQYMHRLVTNSTCFEAAHTPQSNIVCFRFKDELRGLDLNTINTSLRKKLLELGGFYIVQTTIKKEIWLRVTLMNALTTTTDIQDLLSHLQSLAIDGFKSKPSLEDES